MVCAQLVEVPRFERSLPIDRRKDRVAVSGAEA
jgi:hypothetical protein